MFTFPIYEKTGSYNSLKYQLDLIIYIKPPLFKKIKIFLLFQNVIKDRKNTHYHCMKLIHSSLYPESKNFNMFSFIYSAKNRQHKLYCRN